MLFDAEKTGRTMTPSNGSRSFTQPSGFSRATTTTCRDRAEEVLRLQRRLTSELFELTDRALAHSGTECVADLDGWLPSRVLVIDGGGVEEIWCAISVRASDGTFIRPELRDVLFASLEAHVSPAVFEARDDWPTGTIAWYESVRLGLR